MDCQAFHKSHLLRLRVAPSETAMSDVLREVSFVFCMAFSKTAISFLGEVVVYALLSHRIQVMIMKILEHPNIVNLIEVIDDPETDHFYMGTDYPSSLFLPFSISALFGKSL